MQININKNEKINKPMSKYVPIFPLEKAWTEINTPDLVMNVQKITDRNIKQAKT